MNMHDLERHGQPLLQQEANLTYQIGQAKDRLTELQEELAKVRGKLELLREMAEELAEAPGPKVRNRHNGVAVPSDVPSPVGTGRTGEQPQGSPERSEREQDG